MVLLFDRKIGLPSLREEIEEKKNEMKKFYNLDEVVAIRNWLKKQHHLPQITDDEIILFLNSRQFRLERTKLAIDEYFTMRTHAAELFTKRNAKCLMNTNFIPLNFAMYPSDAKTKSGHNIISIGLPYSDPSKFDLALYTKFGMALFDLAVAKNPMTSGIEIILDSKHFTLAHVARINLAVLKKLMLYTQRGLAVRLKAIHVLNTSPATQQVIELIRPFTKSHLMKKIHIYKPSELHLLTDYIPKSILSCDYGGYGESIAKLHDDICEELLSVQDWLDDMDKSQVDEKKRLGKTINSGDIFGMEGSFRKLSFD